MRIRLLHSYSGVLTQERRMAEGIHEVTETFGQYLIDNGHAVAVDEPFSAQVLREKHVFDHTDEPIFDPLPEITEDMVTVERIAEPHSHEWLDEMERDDLMQILDEAGVEYSKHWTTAKLREMVAGHS